MMVDEMGFRENVRKEIARQGFKDPKAFTDAKKLSNSYLNQILNGRRRFNEDTLNKISAALNVPLFQLFADEPLVSKAQSEKDPAIFEVFSDEAAKLEYSKFRTRDDFVPIRIVGTGSLGHGRFVSSEETKGYTLIYRHALPKKAVTQKRDQEKIVGLFVKGDSMSPTILDKSLVAIDLEDRDEIRRNKIYAVEMPDAGVTLKRVIQKDDQFILFADNPNEPGFPTCIGMKGLNYNPICGRVVWAWNKF
jgi:phage repressor protein C with HTH and peptisase S24 domain